MKYQTEYQRNYQNRSPKRFHEFSAEERKLNEVPFKHSSPSRRRGRSVPSSPERNVNYTVIGPNDKFSQSQFYRLREPVKDHTRIPKSKEYAILGRNEKFENNVAYPLRKPVLSDSPRVVVRRRKHENHSCGIQTEKAASASLRESLAHRRRTNTQSEYKDKYDWKRPSTGFANNRISFDDSRLNDQRRSDGYVPSPEKTSVAVNTPARVEIDVNKAKHQAHRRSSPSKKQFRPKRDETTEYRTRYKPTRIEPKKAKMPKAYEAEEIHEREPREILKNEHANTDDEGTYLGNEFRQKYPYGKLRRWKSEYQSTYKPFWRFDYKNGKWYKDTSADDQGFNPNLYWYKELMSARRRADNNRAKAEEDHFNPDHTLQLQTGYNLNNSYQAWDIDDYDNESDSVISIDRDLERERIEGERRREKDARRNEEERLHYEKTYKKPLPPPPPPKKTNQVAQTEHQTDRVVYIDEPRPKEPSLATKAFVRNLSSSSVQQHMSWDSESLCTQRTNSDLDYRPIRTRDAHRVKHSPIKQKSKGTGMHSPIPTERQYTNGYASPKPHQQNGTNQTCVCSPASCHETTNATGRPSYDTQAFNKRPHTTMNEYCTYPGSRFKDEVTDYYYGGDNNRQQPQHYSSPSKPLQTCHDPYGRVHPTYHKDDDVLSARSLSSSCSLASQTLERAQQNMNKYWGDTSSPSKHPSSAKH